MPMTDRRRFLTMLTAATCGATSGIQTNNVLSTSPEPSVPRPCPPTAWKKLGTVLAGGEQPLQNFTCPAEPLENGRWRIWYSQSGSRSGFNVGFAEGRPGEALSRQLAVLSPGEPVDAPLAIGNLPPEFELATDYTVGVCTGSSQPALAEQFAQWLTGPQSRDVRRAGGFEFK